MINEPAAMTVVPSTTIGTCNVNNGSAAVTVSGGIVPYNYNWSNGTNGANMITGLSAGTYSVIVSDANGCSQATSIDVQNTGAVSSSVSSISSPNCFGEANGNATVSISGGTGPFTYSWQPNVSTLATATGLAAGSYSVTITDANQCTTTTNLVVNEPSQLMLNTSSINVNCFGDNTGQAQVVASGGIPPYSYQWSGSTDTDNTLENSFAGIY